MSDNVAATPETPEAPAATIDAESLVKIKMSLIDALNRGYFEFINDCRKLPIHVGMMQKAFNHLDDGLFCLEKAISMIESLPLSPADETVLDAVEPAQQSA